MKIDNYAVAMNAQYYNLEQDITQAKVSQELEDFTSDESLEILNINSKADKGKDGSTELAVELSKALLKRVSNDSSRLTTDRLDIVSIYKEEQALNFEVKAYIQTDTKEIELSLDVSLSRSFVQKTSISLESLKVLKDPLILSLDGGMPALSSKTFSFDIDSDGKSDQISQLSSNSAFLVLDKNSNGVIDDGSELFGTKSGDGFGDLSKYDEDKNGWIDENDAIFDKLQVWKKSDSKDELIGIGEVGIGAIFLGNTNTPFSLRDNLNESLGEMRSSGLFLYENGKAGVISQIDMAVSTDTKESLNSLEGLQKELAPLKLKSLYSDKGSSENSDDSRVEKLQARIREIESKLSSVSGAKRAVLEAELGVLFAQLMATLGKELL